jgi:hypothetical protein
MLRDVHCAYTYSDGNTWCEVFSKHNSGTYNNEFMIVDMKLFTPGSVPPAGTLHVLDQVPGNIQYGDVTDVLVKQAYWPSYNCPYFTSIFNVSGWPELVQQYGNFYSYDKNPRSVGCTGFVLVVFALSWFVCCLPLYCSVPLCLL